MRRPARPLRLLSLRARITIGSTGIAAVVVLLLVLVVRLQVVNVVASATTTLLNTDVAPYVTAIEDGDTSRLSPPGNAQLAAVLDPSGKIAVSTMPRQLERALGTLATKHVGTSLTTVAGSQYRIVIEHPTNESGRWTVVAARNAQSETIVVDGLTRTLGAFGITILLAFGIASWILTTLALRPVSRMRREADRLRAGSDDAELPVGPAHDELASLAMTLNAFLARTRQVTKRERQMVSDASHELRTPLAILTTQLDLASLDAGDAEALQAHIERAKDNVARLSQLASNLLTLSRIEDAGRQGGSEASSTTSWSDLSDEVMAAVDRVRLIAGTKNVTVDFELTPPSGPQDQEPRYRLDRNAMAQLVTNIATNAVAAVQPGGEILVLWRNVSGQGTLDVIDNGPGVPESFVPIAFDRFTRPDAARSSRPQTGAIALGGSGLGLAIVRAIAVRAGGHATLRNREEGGLRVTVTVPEVR